MFVRNDVTRDSRVLREAGTLVAAGHRVTIMGVLTGRGDVPATEARDGFEIIRVEAPSGWRLGWAWLHYPWRLRGRVVGAFKRAVGRGPSGWPSAALILAATVVSIPWTLVRFALHAIGVRPPPKGNLEWWLSWQFTVLGWGRSAGRAAPVADVYHGHDLTGLVGAVAAADRNGGLIVYDSHELFLESGIYAERPKWIRRLIGRLERRLAARASAVVTVNPAIGAEMERRMPVRRLVIVHNCPSRWTPPAVPAGLLRAAASIPAGAPLLLYHGVFANHRGLEQLALASLEPGLEAAHVAYLGYGGSRGELDVLAADPRFGGRLHVVDAVDPSVLLEWVAGADVGVIPGQRSTLNHLLSSPNKLFESLAAGVPVAIMDFPYVHDLVLGNPDGPLGTVCDPADPASIAQAVREIIERPADERAALRDRCLRAAHERWNWETESERLVALYADLAGQVGQAGVTSKSGAGTSQSR
jgi:glycosyltransferase involved in cell wall biosynthesis